MAIIPESEWRLQPWKNGGGVTREILRWPDVDDYDLRVSLADITKNGPFSKFPGYSRFVVWIGPSPIELMVDRQQLTFATQSATSHVLGNPEIFVTLPAGPTKLLNLIVKDGASYEWGYNVPTKPVRFAFVMERLEAQLHEPPERVADRCLWIA